MTDHEVAFIQPAVKGTTGILKSALKIPSIKRIVITSSGVAIIPWKDFFVHGSPHIFTGTSTFPTPHPFASG